MFLGFILMAREVGGATFLWAAMKTNTISSATTFECRFVDRNTPLRLETAATENLSNFWHLVCPLFSICRKLEQGASEKADDRASPEKRSNTEGMNEGKKKKRK